MVQKIYILLLAALLQYSLSAQTLPKEGANLNYRLVGFSFHPVQKVNKYKVEIAIGNFTTEDSFKRNIVKTVESKTNKIVAEVPLFGRQYTWRSVNIDAVRKIAGTSELHHFSTGICEEVDTNSVRLRVVQKAEQYKDAYIFLDGMRALYDMNGRPVWFLPDVPRFSGPPMRPMPVVKNVTMAASSQFVPTNDLKVTSRGTITFVYYETAYEVDYNGNILWSAPDQDKLVGEQREFYHHEFTRLLNGNYLALKNGFVTTWWRWQRHSADDSSMVLVPVAEVQPGAKNVFSRKSELAIVNEYDAQGNKVRSWHSAQYFIDQDKGRELARCIRINPEPMTQEVHANSIYFNEKDSTLYVGFRNTSSIIKLKYPSGTVLGYYGDAKLFCNQHSAHLSSTNDMYLFNNNLCRPGGMPEVFLVRFSDTGKLQVLWNYKCTYEPPADHDHDHGHDHGPPAFSKGGNVIELSGRSVFINMGSGYSKLFIIDKEKKLLWSAMPEKFDPISREWRNVLQYKASVISSRKELENLIWAAENAP